MTFFCSLSRRIGFQFGHSWRAENVSSDTNEALSDLHILKNISIIRVLLAFLRPRPVDIHLAWHTKGCVFSREGRKRSPVRKSCHQGPGHGQRSLLSSPCYFPEQTVIPSILHAYGHECLALPYLNINKKGISWLHFSLEGKEGVKTSSEIWRVSRQHTHAPSCRLSFAGAGYLSTLAAPCPVPAGRKEVTTLSADSCCSIHSRGPALKEQTFLAV